MAEQVIIVKDLIDRKEGNTSKEVLFKFFNLDGSAKDLTGATAFLQFRKGSPTGYVTGDFSIGLGLTWIDDATGQLQLDQILALDFCPDVYYYDVRITDAGGEKNTYVKGTMNVLGIITQTS